MIPEDICEKAQKLASWTFGSSDDKDVMEVVAAFMAERRAQIERIAAMVDDFPWVLPLYHDGGYSAADLNEATDNAACAVQEQIAAAIRKLS